MQFSKSILEAINRGIALALDDFDDDEPVQHIKSKQTNIDHGEVIVNHIFNLIDNGKATKEDLNDLKYWYKLTNLRYRVKSKKQLMDIIVNLSQISPNDIDLNWIDISNLTDLTRVFAKLKNLNIDCAKWDTRHVEKFNYIFAFSSNTNIKANNWQFDSAKEFDGMFYMCKKTMNVEIDAEHWNSENVETMKNMFHGCTNQNLLHYASKLDIENCVGFEKMFRHSNCKEDLSSWEISNNLSKTFDISDPFDEWDSMFGGVKTMTIDMLPKLVKNKSQSSDPMKKRFEHDVKRFCEETGSQCIIKINERPGGYQCNDITFPDETTGFLIEYINNRTNKLDEYALWFNYSTIGLDNSTIIGHTLNELIKKANNRFTKRIKKLNKK